MNIQATPVAVVCFAQAAVIAGWILMGTDAQFSSSHLVWFAIGYTCMGLATCLTGRVGNLPKATNTQANEQETSINNEPVSLVLLESDRDPWEQIEAILDSETPRFVRNTTIGCGDGSSEWAAWQCTKCGYVSCGLEDREPTSCFHCSQQDSNGTGADQPH